MAKKIKVGSIVGISGAVQNLGESDYTNDYDEDVATVLSLSEDGQTATVQIHGKGGPKVITWIGNLAYVADNMFSVGDLVALKPLKIVDVDINDDWGETKIIYELEISEDMDNIYVTSDEIAQSLITGLN